MAPPPHASPAHLAGLVADASLVAAVTGDAVAALWSADGPRLLWASAAGTALAHHLSFAARQRIGVLAGGLAPTQGVRLERLRLGPGSRAELVTCACRRIALVSGEMALLTLATGVLPRRLRDAIPTDETEKGADPSAGQSLMEPLATVQALAARRATVRFVWEVDVAGVFTRVSPDLAALVGEASAAVVGRAWGDLGDTVSDPDLEVAAALAIRRTWSGRTVLWRIGATRAAVPVELAAVPVLDAGRRFAGFRGFGLARLGGLVAEAWPADETAPEMPAEAGEAVPIDPSGPGAAEPVAAEPPSPNADHTLEERPPEPAPQLLVPPERGLAPLIPFPTIRTAVPARFDLSRPPQLRLVGAPAAGQRPASKLRPGESLSPNERNAFREIARALGARFAGDESEPPAPERAETPQDAAPEDAAAMPASTPRSPPKTAAAGPASAALLDRLPLGIVVNRGETPVYANRAFLDLIGRDSLAALAEAGLASLFDTRPPDSSAGADAPLPLMTASGEIVAAEVQLAAIDWDGAPATLMTFRRFVDPQAARRLRALELDLGARESRENELISILDTATDGVIVVDERGRMLSLNRSAEALFGYDQNEVAGEMFTLLLAPESHAAAYDYLERLKSSGVASLLNDGREVIGRVRQGGRLPLFMTLGRVGEGREHKFCAVLRDMTAWKKAESELTEAKKAAERASAQKSDFLAKISHEIRTPLNAVIGFAEVMLEERFGAIGVDRYKEYLRDIHASGGHVISLVNDLLDLAKIEAGRLELTFASVRLNDVVAGCVALLQPEANRERIVLRTSLAPRLPPIVADERSMRQVVLNVLSNAVKFTDAGGQVIVSTTLTERGEVALRVRDTGIGMTDKELEAALEPFRQLATARRAGGTGLGLPLTKALIEANRGSLSITSARHEGTLVEVLMPRTRVLAE